MQFSHKIKIGIFVVICSMFIHAYADAPMFRWAQRAGGTNMDYATGVAVDSLGNTFITGRCTSSDATFGNVAFSNGPTFLAKLNGNGDVVWAKGLGADVWYSYTPWPYRFAADGSGGVVLCGNIRSGASSITIDGVTLTRSSPPTSPAAFIARFDNSGQLALARVLADTTNYCVNYAKAVATDGNGNIFLTGMHNGTTGLGFTNWGIYAAKFDSNGDLTWAKSLASMPDGYVDCDPIAFIPLADGDFVVAGLFTSAMLNLDGITLTNNGGGLGGGISLSLAKYNSERKILWARCVTSPSSSFGGPAAIRADAAGNLYVMGYSDGATVKVLPDESTFTNAQFSALIFKFSTNGQLLWGRLAGEIPAGWAVDFDVDAVGNSYICGDFNSIAYFGDIILTESFPSYLRVYFLAKLAPEGSFLWAKAFGTEDSINSDQVWDRPTIRVATDSQGNCSFAASFNRTNSPVDSFMLTSLGKGDAFVARIEADPPWLGITSSDNAVVISWPTNQPGFVLEAATVLPATDGWTAVTNAIAVVSAQYFVTNSVAVGSQFYRLRKP